MKKIACVIMLAFLWIIIGCQHMVTDYNQTLQQHIERTIPLLSKNYIVSKISYDYESDLATITLIDLDDKKSYLLDYTKGSMSILRTRAITESEIGRNANCTQNFALLKIDPRNSIEHVNQEKAANGYAAIFAPSLENGQCSNRWLVMGRNSAHEVDATTGKVK